LVFNTRCLFADILLEDNRFLRKALEKKVLPKREFMKVPIGGGLRKWTLTTAYSLHLYVYIYSNRSKWQRVI